jgi:hypothetical protein
MSTAHPSAPRAGAFTLYKTLSNDGGLTWSAPEAVWQGSDVHLCEPGCIRSPDGKQLAVLLRENARRKNSHVIFSDDEGRTWTEPREVAAGLDRRPAHGQVRPRRPATGQFPLHFAEPRSALSVPSRPTGPAGSERMTTSFRAVRGSMSCDSSRTTATHDTTYPGVEVLPDGTFVVTTYGHWTAGEQPYIMSVRLKLEELDSLAEKMER